MTWTGGAVPDIHGSSDRWLQATYDAMIDTIRQGTDADEAVRQLAQRAQESLPAKLKRHNARRSLGQRIWLAAVAVMLLLAAGSATILPYVENSRGLNVAIHQDQTGSVYVSLDNGSVSLTDGAPVDTWKCTVQVDGSQHWSGPCLEMNRYSIADLQFDHNYAISVVVADRRGGIILRSTERIKIQRPTPEPVMTSISLSQGGVAPSGYFYVIALNHFPPHSEVAVACYDSTYPEAFHTFTMTTDSSGGGSTQGPCYSGDGPYHWVTARGVESNHVRWNTSLIPDPPLPSIQPPSQPSPPSTRAETTGGVVHTWSDYVKAGGLPGGTIPSFTTVEISCRVQGFKAANGNTWWYRIASPKWDNLFYASADSFYNNGQTSGSLQGTPFVDEAVPLC